MDQNINQMIGRIDERTEMTLRLMKEFKDEFRNVSDDHEMRLSSLENDRSQAKGMIYIIGVVAGGIGAWISKLVGLHG